MAGLNRIRPDPYTVALFGAVAVASFLPSRGVVAEILGWVTNLAIALLFFLHGARLPRHEVLEGARHWRLHLVILGSTFVLFPLLGLALGFLLPVLPVRDPELAQQLYLGILFVCVLPSTVQSSIAFTSIARGNVPAAVCAATLSNLIGILLTPVLVGVLMRLHGGGISLAGLWRIVLQLLVPFVAGQILRPWLSGWVTRNRKLLGLTDRGTILLVVYTAFSEAVVQGIWHKLPPVWLALLVIVDGILLAVVLIATTGLSRLFRFPRADEAAIVFCGSKKSLASGAPMAQVLFAGSLVGMTMLPLMIFHQMQLVVCAALARRYARRAAVEEDGRSVPASPAGPPV